jgi:membrane protein YqaA with SNARE-associated domain
LHLGAVGLVLLGVLDSSFLFLPFGNDILLVYLVARDGEGFLWYVLAASVGSTLGVVLLDLVSRRIGQEGLSRVLHPKRLEYVMAKMKQRAAVGISIACLAPPPFPFTLVVAGASALQYPRTRLLGVVFAGRSLRFFLIGLAALRYGRKILRIASSAGFEQFMIGFTVVCVIGSTISVTNWVRRSKTSRRPGAAH